MDLRKYRLPATIALLLGFAVLFFIIVLTAIHAVGTDDGLYYSEQTFQDKLPSWDIEANYGITDDELRTLDQQLADYLRGDETALTPGDPFNEREMAHMKDCFDLFDLLRKVRSRLIPWAVLLIVGGAYVLRDRRRIRLCAWLSPLILILPLGAFAIYAVVDFDAAFTLFHKVLFTNDLWLLDPATDLLIRICPASMFMHMGVRIGAYSLIGIVAVSAVATLVTFIWPKGKEENTWKTTPRRGPAPKQITFGNRGTR